MPRKRRQSIPATTRRSSSSSESEPRAGFLTRYHSLSLADHCSIGTHTWRQSVTITEQFDTPSRFRDASTPSLFAPDILSRNPKNHCRFSSSTGSPPEAVAVQTTRSGFTGGGGAAARADTGGGGGLRGPGPPRRADGGGRAPSVVDFGGGPKIVRDPYVAGGVKK